jgi:hypothetical protein
VVKLTSRLTLVVASLGLIGALALVVVVRAHSPSTATTTLSKTQAAAFTAIAASPLTAKADTIWLIAPNGSVKLLKRSSSSFVSASSIPVVTSSTPSGVLCKADAFGSGTLQGGYAEGAVFSVPKGMSALVGDFVGNSGNGDKSFDLIKGLQYTATSATVTIEDPFTTAVPFTGYFNLLATAAKTC